MFHQFDLVASFLFGFAAYFLVRTCIPLVSETFILKGLAGKDLLKSDRPVTPESMGAIVGVVYMCCMFLFIPIPFMEWFNDNSQVFPYPKFALFLGSLLAILSMLFLGFADDVIDIRWRVKIWFPLFASIPLLTVYYVAFNETTVVVPRPLREFIGNSIDLGPIYYVYMSALCIFSTNSINILAGVNGIEGSQALMIALSILSNDLYHLFTSDNVATLQAHSLSAFFLIPFIGATLGYLKHNWFPARAFGGDTFAYFSGMILSVVAVQGRFTKTVLLFMVPQIFNFLYSCPQLFGFVECPRHRMPKLDSKTGLVVYSTTSLLTAKPLGLFIVKIFSALRILNVEYDKNGKPVEANNFTLINLILCKFGPMREDMVVVKLIQLHVLLSLVAFIVRYPLAQLWY